MSGYGWDGFVLLFLCCYGLLRSVLDVVWAWGRLTVKGWRWWKGRG